jgi:hypothetical protein
MLPETMEMHSFIEINRRTLLVAAVTLVTPVLSEDRRLTSALIPLNSAACYLSHSGGDEPANIPP